MDQEAIRGSPVLPYIDFVVKKSNFQGKCGHSLRPGLQDSSGDLFVPVLSRLEIIDQFKS